MNNVPHPNKIFVLDIVKESSFVGMRKHVLIIAADSKETATQYLKDKLSYDCNPNELDWLMNANHEIIYDQTGKKADVQAKILYNTSVIIGG